MSNPKATILIVDDHLPNLDLIIDVLNEQGFQAHSATTGNSALKVIETHPPDLILLDIEMPGMNGYQVCEHVKSHPETQDIPVIFISISDQVLDKVRAFSVGGADYITKPFQIEEMLARVQTHLTLRNLNIELAEKNRELQQEITKRKEYEKQLKEMARTDPLTKAHNRRSFFELAERELVHTQNTKQPLAIIIMDIDRFKTVNDSYGHLIGDQVLINLVKLCQSKIRDVDLFARLGGEEFVILMPNTSIEPAQNTAERIRKVVFESFMATGRANVLITISLGVVCWDGHGDLDINKLLDKADKALYLSKEAGRNRVSTWEETQSADDIRSIIDHLN